jgi:hypothetical protein
MGTSIGRYRVLALSSVVGVSALAYACGSGDENPAVDHGKVAGTDSGTVDPTGVPPTTPPSAFCGKYGGVTNVNAMAANILSKAQADCRISGGFAGLNQGQQQHLLECFQVQLGNAFHCDGVTYVAGQTKDSKGNECRSMSDAHSPNNMPGNMRLRNADYLAFLDAVSSTFNAQQGATKEDLTSVAAFFEGQKTNIVQTADQPDRNSYCPADKSCTTCQPPDIIDAGKDAEGGIKDSGGDVQDAADSG